MPTEGDRAVLDPMITVSSNDAASTIYYRVGDAALYDLAKRAGMTHFSVARLLGERPLQRRGPGALLQQDRPADPEGVARLRAHAPVLDRLLPALGLLALLARARLQDLLQGRLARHRRGAARPRGGPVRARPAAHLDGGADRRQPVAGLRAGDAPRRRTAHLPLARRPVGTGRRSAEGRGRLPRHPARGPRRRPPLRAGDPGRPLLPHQAQRDGRAAAGLLQELGPDARAGRVQPRARCSATSAARASGS